MFKRLMCAGVVSLALAVGCDESVPTEPLLGSPTMDIIGTTGQTLGANASISVAAQVTGVSPANGLIVNFVVTGGNGNTLVPVAVTARPSSGPGAGMQGVASTIWNVGTKSGSASLEARLVDAASGAIITAGRFNVTVLPGSPSSVVKFDGDNQSTVVGAQVPLPPTVQVLDQYGNLVPNAAVTFFVQVGGGSVPLAVVNTTPGGRAATTWNLGSVAGLNLLNASIQCSPCGGPTLMQFTALGRAGAASRLVTAQRVFSPHIATTIAPTAQVTDANGNGVANVAVTFTVKSGGGSLDGVGTISTLTDASGNARATWMVGATIVSNALQATVQGLLGNPITFVAIPYECDCWSTKAPMPTVRRDVGSATLNGQIHTAAGSNNAAGGYFSTHEVYDPAADGWTTKMSTPAPYAFPTGGALGGQFYLVSGFGLPQMTTRVQAYDPSLNTWTTKASIPTGRLGTASAVINNLMYVIGGDLTGNNAPGTANEVYDPILDAWMVRTPMPQARWMLASGVANGRIYVIGGFTGSLPESARVDVYDPGSDTWTTVASMPTARFGATSASVNGFLYVFGGFDSVGKLGTVEVYDPATDVWVTRTSMPTPRGSAVAGVVSGRVYLIGGRNENGVQAFGTNEAYRP